MKKKGFTLLEVLIGLAVLSILLIPTANIILSTVKNVKQNQDKQQARLLAQKTIEEIKAIDSISEVTLSNGVKIIKSQTSPSYYMSSVIDGFNIAGEIKLNQLLTDNYDDLTSKAVSCIIEVNKQDIKYSYSQPMSIEKYLNETIPQNSLTDIENLKITLDNSNISINSNFYNISSTAPIIVLLNEDRSSNSLTPVSITIENESDNNCEVYIVGNSGIDIDKNYTINYIKGDVSVYTSTINTDSREKGIYSVSLTVTKDSKVLENINAQKVVK